MHDIKKIRENPQEFDRQLARRGLPPKSAEILELDDGLRDSKTKLQTLQAEINKNNKEIGRFMQIKKKVMQAVQDEEMTWEKATDLMLQYGWPPEEIQFQINRGVPWPFYFQLMKLEVFDDEELSTPT